MNTATNHTALLTISGINAMLDATQAKRDAARAEEEKRDGELESKECGRCGGTGRFSYCPGRGTVCFDCEGRKRILTKRGELAARYRTQLRSKATRDLVAGDKVHNPGVPGYIASKWDLVAGVDVIGERARIVYATGHSGEWISASTLHRVAQTLEQTHATHALALAYQAALNLTKAGKIAKRVKRPA